jgi:Na+-translocating ferredoxin:NAD+ oxidoreductase RnfA subunit
MLLPEMLAMVIQRNGPVLYKLMGLGLVLGLQVDFLVLGLLLNNKLKKSK